MNTTTTRPSFSRALPTALAACLLLAPAAVATPIFDSFGPFPNATFGGTGIPNNAVAASTQFINGDDVITVALAATQRFSNPALTNDGAGTYFATPGSNFGGNGESATEGSFWNFNYYIEIEGNNGNTPVLTDYQFDLLYDFDPGFDTPLTSLGTIDITGGLASISSTSTLEQDSQNLLFGFLENPVFPLSLFITPPAGSFDPNASGEYTFAIGVSTLGGFPLDSVAIDVVVVPEPASLGLFALAGIATATRRRRV